MKKVNLLSKAEMKNVLGGNPPEDGGEPGPKIKACEGKKVNDPCFWEWNGTPQSGYCQSYMAQPLHCSNLL